MDMNKFIITAALIAIPAITFAQNDRVQCTETTKKNTQCKNLAVVGRNLCWQHDSTYVKPVKLESTMCTGTKKDGNPCSLRTKHSSGRCHHHRN